MTQMSLNVQESQKNGVLEMLSLNSHHEESRSFTPSAAFSEDGNTQWKVLVYDTFCRDVLGPLVKVGELRQHGVTLNLLIDAERSAVNEVPAVYFVLPTQENIDRIVNDISANLYQCYYLNFCGTVTDDLLQKLATHASRNNTVASVRRVVDRYLDYISLSSVEFALNIPRAYSALHGQSTDLEIEGVLNQTAGRLFSVLTSICGSIPIIRCPSSPGSPARMLGEKLEKIIAGHLSQRTTSSKQLLGGSSSSANSLTRPVLILLDRDVDYAIMLRHSWLYQPLIHDLLTLRHNKTTVPVESANPETEASVPPQSKRYDLNSTDQFWNQYAGTPFTEVGLAVGDSLADYNKRMQELSSNRGGDDVYREEDITAELSIAITALPEMTERKRTLDVHTNIASALVKEIKARKLDRYFELEEEVALGAVSTASAINQLEQLINSNDGTWTDKERMVLCFHLARPNVSSQDLEKLKQSLMSGGGSTSALEYLQHIGTFKQMQNELMSQAGPGAAGSLPTTAAAQAAAAWIDRSKGILLQGVKQLLPLKTVPPIAKICEALMEQKDSSVTDSFTYLDPMSGRLAMELPRLRTPFKHSIVFVMGGGNYTESLALKELSARAQKQIVYGSTDFTSPSQFLDELTELHRGKAN